MMGIKVAKFGGTSLANAAQIRKVQAIVEADPARRYVVPSAPGKRTSDDRKITDLLYLCHENAAQRMPIDDVWGIVAQRYLEIVRELGLKLDLGPVLEETKKRIIEIGAASVNGNKADFAASRGEYLNGLIVAELLGYTFVDAAEVVFFTDAGRLDAERTYKAVGDRLGKLERAVVPGFYGAMPDGSIKTFSRGGSDISGAIVARGVMAEVYENWTDVSGLLMADPRIVKNPKVIQTITYKELRELAYMGATVLHDEAVFPVRQAGIPVNIRNTNEPDAPGSLIFRGDMRSGGGGKPTQFTISGIAGRKDFTVIAIEKAMMNAEIGFGRRVLSALEVNGVSFEHTPSGIDTMSIVVADDQLKGKLDKVVEDIRVECRPDSIDVYPRMALIATVGRGMAHVPGTAAKVFNALADAKVNVRMIDQGSSEINIIVGVETADFEKAVQAIYAAFVG